MIVYRITVFVGNSNTNVRLRQYYFSPDVALKNKRECELMYGGRTVMETIERKKINGEWHDRVIG